MKNVNLIKKKAMTLVIDKKLSLKEIKTALEQIVKAKKTTGLKKHFGLSKNEIDALDFQNKIRNEWNWFFSRYLFFWFILIQRGQFKDLINDCFIIEMDYKIKTKCIEIRNKYKLKIPNAIIAASAIVYNLPLITSDKEFEKVKELDLIFIKKD